MKKRKLSLGSNGDEAPLSRADVGVFGGSGFYSLFDKFETVKMTTPYGAPSSEITIAEIHGKRVAFLPRHGKNHQYPPHKIPYKANIYALKKLGVKRIISPCAAGSLNFKIAPGDFVVLDQFVDRTHHRDDTFYHGPETVHISSAHPYCTDLQTMALKAGRKLKIKTHKKGTAVIINGPRFSTSAESLYYSNLGYDVINMTQYPEVVLAREQEICFLGIALVTDWDAGLIAKGKVKPVEIKDVLKIFNENIEKSRNLIFEIIKNLPSTRNCLCKTALLNAQIKA
ncbi:MAG: S-methyl-5'-thioadenosine phosphorylase [Patescibacteria group bacterium]|nr:S-methyl-5'-thioadenosine phosphorylase [Patescibacteria group bacterium]